MTLCDRVSRGGCERAAARSETRGWEVSRGTGVSRRVSPRAGASVYGGRGAARTPHGRTAELKAQLSLAERHNVRHRARDVDDACRVTRLYGRWQRLQRVDATAERRQRRIRILCRHRRARRDPPAWVIRARPQTVCVHVCLCLEISL